MPRLRNTIQTAMKGVRENYRISSMAVHACIFSPFVIVALFYGLLSVPETRPATRLLLSENYPVEMLTFVSMFCAGLLGFRLAGSARRSGNGKLVPAFYAVFSILLLLAAMEEISWGQWILGFETPAAIKAVNRQHEFNLHNIRGLHAPFEFLRILFGLAGLAGAWLTWKRRMPEIGAPVILVPWFALIAVLAALDFHNYFIFHRERIFYYAAAQLVEVLELLIGVSAFLYMWLNQRSLTTPET